MRGSFSGVVAGGLAAPTHLQVLDLLDELDVLLGQAGLVGGDVDDGAVQFLDLDVELADRNLQLFGVLDGDEFLLVDGFDLGEEFVHLRLEFALFLFSSGTNENTFWLG